MNTTEKKYIVFHRPPCFCEDGCSCDSFDEIKGEFKDRVEAERLSRQILGSWVEEVANA